jgi:predicted transcriptional regulator
MLLSEREVPTGDLIEEVDASSSAVYSALSDLDSRGLVRETADGWELTGRGQVVADTVSHRQSTEEFLAGDPDYWQNYRTDVLPKRFRLRLPEIGSYEVVRNDETAVDNRKKQVVSRLRRADSASLISSVYARAFEEAVPNTPESRLLLSREIIDLVLQRLDSGQRDQFRLTPEPEIRLAPTELQLNYSAEYMYFVLPHRTNDRPTAMVASETDTAIQWAEELFESFWTDAEPLAAYLDEIGRQELL